MSRDQLAAPPRALLPRDGAALRRGLLLAVLLGGQFMANVDTAIVNTAAPSIRTGLATSQGPVALVVSGYVVAYAVLLTLGARLGATYGHRRVFLLGLLGFTAASLACGLAPGIAVLVVARLVQGAAAALMVPQVLSGIQLHFTGPDRVRALGYYAVALSGGAVVGQALGGLLISADLFGATWRPIFLINVPLGAALLIAARRAMPADGARSGGGLDLGGAFTLSAAVLLLIVPLVLGPDLGWPWWAWLCLAASVPMAAAFVLVERRVAARGDRPLVTAAVLARPAVRHGLLAYGLTTMTYFALLFVVAVYLQQGLGRGPAYAGLSMVSWVAAFGLAGVLMRRLPARFLPVAPAAGCLVLAAGYAGVAAYTLAGGGAGPVLFALLGVGGFGLGASANSLIHAMTSALPVRYATDLTGAIGTGAQLAGALGVAAASTGYAALRGSAGLAAPTAFAAVTGGFLVLALAAAPVALSLRRTPR